MANPKIVYIMHRSDHPVIFLIGLLLTVSLNQALKAQTNTNSFQTSLTQDVVSNLEGGIQQGQAHMGLINIDLSLQTENQDLWDNGTFRVQIQNTYGQQPSSQLVGDIQVFSNIENKNCSYLYQFYYQHQWKNATLLIGKQDLNERFFVSEPAGHFINSSFGIMPVASLNTPVSIFPSTTLGIIGRYQFSDQQSLQGAIYNGLPGEITDCNFGTDLNLDIRHGLFHILEWHLQKDILSNPASIKVGGFYHSGKYQLPGDHGITVRGASGLYLMVNQGIFREYTDHNRGMDLFLQMGHSPNPAALIDSHLTCGLTYTGLIPGADKDQVGLAVAHASINNRLMNGHPAAYQAGETALEFTYKHHLTDGLVLQPDLQYIIHPGMQASSNNSVIGMLRLHWAYND
jgi:porin